MTKKQMHCALCCASAKCFRYLRYLGSYKTSADQAEFYALAFEAATMFITKNIAEGMICTDYTDREYIVMRNITLTEIQSVAVGDAVYMTSDDFALRASGEDFDAAAAAATWIEIAQVIGLLFASAVSLFIANKIKGDKTNPAPMLLQTSNAIVCCCSKCRQR